MEGLGVRLSRHRTTHQGHELVQVIAVQHTLHVAAGSTVRGVLELRADSGLSGRGSLQEAPPAVGNALHYKGTEVAFNAC